MLTQSPVKVVDRLTPEQRSANMRSIRSKGMKPEMVVRRLVHGMGFRYRLHRHDLPGRPDMIFQSRRKVIFVHGCFWHQHTDPKCKLAHRPRSNVEYWESKLNRNQKRDHENYRNLSLAGWRVLTLWECEVKQISRSELAVRLRKFLDGDCDDRA